MPYYKREYIQNESYKMVQMLKDLSHAKTYTLHVNSQPEKMQKVGSFFVS